MTYNVGDVIEVDGIKYTIVAVAHSNEEKVALLKKHNPIDMVLHVSDTEKYLLRRVE